METYIALKDTKHVLAMRIDGASNPNEVIRSIARSVGRGFLSKVSQSPPLPHHRKRLWTIAEGYVVYRNAADESKQVVFYLSNLKTRSKSGNMQALRVDNLELKSNDWDLVSNEN